MKKKSNKSIQVCLFGALPDTKNLGVSALLFSTMAGLYKQDPSIKIFVFDCGKGVRNAVFTDGEKTYQYQLCGAYNTRRFYRRESLWNMRVSSFFGGLGNPAIKIIKESNAVLDMSGGDSFTDLYGSRRFDFIVLPKLITLQNKIPLILLPQTYGPFNGEKYLKIAESIVKESKAAWARDERSFLALKQLLDNKFDSERHKSGVDVAFLLPSYEPKKTLTDKISQWLNKERNKPVIGFNISGLIYNDPKAAVHQYGFRADYKKVVINFLTKILKETDVNILLIPHVLDKEGHYESDVGANNNVAELLKSISTDRLENIPPAYDQSEIKWIISKCDWFCGTRMHSTIAGLSSGVPTATISYSIKAQGVFESCNQGDKVLDPKVLDTQDIIDKLFSIYKTYKQSKYDILHSKDKVKQLAEIQMNEIVKACSD